ncbi:MAG: peptidylprolyl isomerase [Deltaproteobacteria bacterium]|nr:peptidylprolyl isomerase [Deltaproteobacteria bacterium]
MKIQNEAYVEIDYTLTDQTGKVVDKSEPGSPLGFIYGQGQIIPGLEKAIAGMGVDESKNVVVPPSEGYGDVSEEMFQEIPKDNFPSDSTLTAGQEFQANTPHGVMRFVIHEIKDDAIVVDLNHPLAGQDLHFDVKIVTVREATDDELNPHCNGGHECSSCGHH